MENIRKLAAFADGDTGGNPAGVAFVDKFPNDAAMVELAAQVGFSETVFACVREKNIAIRFFSPHQEVDFCGHATLALGYELSRRFGPGRYGLSLKRSEIEVSIDNSGQIALVSPETSVKEISQVRCREYMQLFNLTDADLSQTLPVMIGHAGNDHVLIPLASKQKLEAMKYDFSAAQQIMKRDSIVTIALFFREAPGLIHVRNAFAFGGVYEDPATGAAAAAIMGYLRHLNQLDFREQRARLTLLQGQAMGIPCRLEVSATSSPESGITVAGRVREL